MKLMRSGCMGGNVVVEKGKYDNQFRSFDLGHKTVFGTW